MDHEAHELQPNHTDKTKRIPWRRKGPRGRNLGGPDSSCQETVLVFCYTESDMVELPSMPRVSLQIPPLAKGGRGICPRQSIEKEMNICPTTENDIANSTNEA